MEVFHSTASEVFDVEGLTPSELIKRHIKDPGHVVTDEEIKKLRVGEKAPYKRTSLKDFDAREADNTQGFLSYSLRRWA